MSILWGLSLFLHQRAQAQGCLVKRKGGRKEKRKEREGRKEGERDFLEGSSGSRLLREKRCRQGMEAPRNPRLLREGDNKQKPSVSFKSHLALFRGTDGELSPRPLAAQRGSGIAWELVRNVGFGAPPQIWWESGSFF